MNPTAYNKKIILAFVIVFISGIAIGWVAGMILSKQQSGVRRPDMPHLRGRMLAGMAQRLSLNHQQTEAAAVIINRMCERIQQTRRDNSNRIAAIINDAFTELTPLLTSEQQTELLKLQKELSSRRRRRRCHGRGCKDGSGIPGHRRQCHDSRAEQPGRGQQTVTGACPVESE